MSQPPQNLDQDDSYLVLVLEKTRTKLLDKTRRNRLINYKESARDIAIIDEMPDQVYTQLVLNGKAFYFDSYEPPEEVTDSPEQGIEPLIDRTLPESQHTDLGVAARHRDDRLQTPFPKQDLERRLRKLYLDHRTIIEETGANNLYLALGFLQWCETGDDPLPQRSPLIFIPVRLERSRGMGAAVYTLTFDDEALDTNYSLHEKLKHNFEITLPLLKEEQLPEDYWTEVSRAIAPKQRDGWTIVRETAVGLFRFHKQIMWHDLDPKRWPAHAPITDKPLIKRILVGPKEGEPVPGPRTQEHYPDESDETNPVPQLPLIRDADSSQYTALAGC